MPLSALRSIAIPEGEPLQVLRDHVRPPAAQEIDAHYRSAVADDCHRAADEAAVQAIPGQTDRTRAQSWACCRRARAGTVDGSRQCGDGCVCRNTFRWCSRHRSLAALSISIRAGHHPSVAPLLITTSCAREIDLNSAITPSASSSRPLTDRPRGTPLSETSAAPARHRRRAPPRGTRQDSHWGPRTRRQPVGPLHVERASTRRGTVTSFGCEGRQHPGSYSNRRCAFSAHRGAMGRRASTSARPRLALLSLVPTRATQRARLHQERSIILF